MSDLAARLNTALAGRYAIQRELGAGGMAIVFLAEDLKHRRSVAIKVLDPDLASTIGPERFLREIELAARLQHPHILPLLDSGDADGLLFYVMPYVEGESLRARLERERQLPVRDALRLAGQVASALDYAHRQGVIHRDIKPENILLADGQAVVADFGIARAVLAAGASKVTATGVTLGTPAYMSPEQAMGSASLDGRSDLYALGCVLYEMLAGQPPFTGPVEGLVHQHLSVAPRPVSALRTTVPKPVDDALETALAKAPADRFGTASEFAAAIAPSAEPVATGQRSRSDEETTRAPGPVGETGGTKPAMRRARQWVVAAGGIVLAVAVVAVSQKRGSFSHWFGGSSTTHPVNKDWILVAEFDGPPNDSSLAVTTRDLVSAALDQSAIVATVPPEQIRIALQMAGKPATTRVDAELAKQLAYRSAVRTVVEGKVGRLGQGYSVILRVVDAESLKVVLTESAVAKNQDALIPTLGRLVEKLRAGLGEQRSVIQANRPSDPVATPSYEAYRLYVRGMRLTASFSSEEAIATYREALALDPDFAYAWRRLGVAYSNIDQPDSGLAAFDQALRHPDRLTAIQRLEVEALRASDSGDLRAALATYDRILQADSSGYYALGRGFVLEGMGRLEEALESTRMAERRSPFGVSQVMQFNESRQLQRLGRLDEAREAARNLTGMFGTLGRLGIEIQATHRAAAEHVLDSLLAEPGLDEGDRSIAFLQLAEVQSARGAFKAAARTFERAEEVARAAPLPSSYQNRSWRGRLMLTIASESALPLPGGAWTDDSSTITLLTRGLRAAIVGDRPGAQRLLEAAQARWAHSPPERAWQGATPELLEARIEALAGRWDEAARILRPVAAQRVEFGTRIPGAAGMSTVRWFLADVFERLGQPDSAAVVLERVVSDPAPWEFGTVAPFAHRRLVLLYARMGRLEDARRHWQIFSETVRTPDPEIQPLIAEARAALVSAEGMAKSARR